MKGLAFRTVVLLIIALIVIAVALYFLSQLPNLEEMFMSPDQRILMKYSTCSMAYCSNGAGSDQVKKVGCLKTENGPCVLTCEDVEEKIFYNIKDAEGKPVGGFSTSTSGTKKHYCGKDFALDFEFTGLGVGGVVPLKSGQMDAALAKQPQWVCKPMKIPFTNIEIDEYQRYTVSPAFLKLTTADAQYTGDFGGFFTFSKNCMMLSKSVTDATTYANTITFAVNFIPVVGQIDDVAKAGLGALKTASKAFRVSVSRGGKSALLYRAPNAFRKAFQAQTSSVAGSARSIEVATASGTVSSFLVGSSDINDPHRSRGMLTKGGCFTGYAYDYTDDEYESRLDILYSPIIQYYNTKEGKKVKIYPSAIYVDESFIESSECKWEDEDFVETKKKLDSGTSKDKIMEEYKKEYIDANRGNPEYQEGAYNGEKVTVDIIRGHSVQKSVAEYILDEDATAYANSKFSRGSITGVDVYGTSVLSGTVEFDFGNMVRDCNFKTREDGKKIKYYIWSNPTYPGIGTSKAAEALGGDITKGLGALVGVNSDESKVIQTSVTSNEYFEDFLSKVNEIDSKISQYGNIKSNVDSLEKEISEAPQGTDTKELIEKRDSAKTELEKLEIELENLIDQYASQNRWDDQKKKEMLEKLKKDPSGFKKEVGLDDGEKESTTNDDWHEKFGSCAFVTLSRDPNAIGVESPGSIQADTSLQLAKPEGGEMARDDSSETGASMVADGGVLHAFFQRTGGQPFEGDSADIVHATSSDGKTWTTETFAAGGGVRASQPSAAKTSGGIYVTYARRGASSEDIFVKKVGGEESAVIIDGADQGSPSMAELNGKFYLFYHQRSVISQRLGSRESYKIMYVEGEEKDGKITWSSPKDASILNVQKETSQNPSATAVFTGGSRIIVSYVASGQTINDQKLSSGIEMSLRSWTAEFDGAAFSKNVPVTTASESVVRAGNPKLVELNGDIYTFFDRGTEDDFNNAETFESRIAYKRYLGDGWEEYSQDPFLKLGADIPENAIQPAPVVLNGRLALAFSRFNKPSGKVGTWDILTSVQPAPEIKTEVLSISGIEASTDKILYQPGETMKISGKISYTSGDPSGQKISIQSYYYTGSDRPDESLDSGIKGPQTMNIITEAITDSEGKFAAEQKASSQPSFYSVQAAYGDKKSKYLIFEVK